MGIPAIAITGGPGEPHSAGGRQLCAMQHLARPTSPLHTARHAAHGLCPCHHHLAVKTVTMGLGLYRCPHSRSSIGGGGSGGLSPEPQQALMAATLGTLVGAEVSSGRVKGSTPGHRQPAAPYTGQAHCWPLCAHHNRADTCPHLPLSWCPCARHTASTSCGRLVWWPGRAFGGIHRRQIPTGLPERSRTRGQPSRSSAYAMVLPRLSPANAAPPAPGPLLGD